MTDKEIKPGDHVTVAGTVVEFEINNFMKVRTQSGRTFIVNREDIQTHRPMKEEHE